MAEHNQRPRRGRRRRDCCATSPMRLSEYCGEGTYAYLLDRETHRPGRRPLVVFDTRRCPTDVLRPGDVRDHGVRHRTPSSATGRAQRPRRPEPGAPLFAGRSIMLIDEAWHIVGRARDRRVRQRPRPPRPPPRAGADRDEPAALGLRHRARARAAAATPRCSCCSPSTPTRCPFIRVALQLSDERGRGWSGGSRPSRAATPRCCGSTAPAAAAASPCASGRPSTGPSPPTRAPTSPLRDAKLAEHAGDAVGGDRRARPARQPRAPANRATASRRRDGRLRCPPCGRARATAT